MMMSVYSYSESHQDSHNYAYEGKDLDVANTEEVVTSPDQDPPSPEPVPYKGRNIEVNGKQEEPAVVWEQYLGKQEDKIPVKALRKLIPQGFKECYHQNDDDSTKKKLKHQWDIRPDDWPENITFVDPNNGVRPSDKASGKSGSSGSLKPGKEKLIEMFRFLKHKYEQCPRDKNGKISSTGPVDNLQMTLNRVERKINEVKLALKSGQMFVGSFNELEQVCEILQRLYTSARNGFSEKKQFFDASHKIETHMDLAIEDLNYLFSDNCDLLNILDTYGPQRSINLQKTGQQFYDVSKTTPSQTTTSEMCVPFDKNVNEVNTYYSFASQEDVKTVMNQSDLVARDDANFLPKSENTPTPVIDLNCNVGIQESLHMKPEGLSSCMAGPHPVPELPMKQDPMATVQFTTDSLFPGSGTTLNLDTQLQLNPVATEPEVPVEMPNVSRQAVSPKMQQPEAVLSSNSSLMDASIVVNPVRNAVANLVVNQIQPYPQQCLSQDQQDNHPLDQPDQPPGLNTTNVLELLVQGMDPETIQALIKQFGTIDTVVCEQGQLQELEAQQPSQTGMEGQLVHDQQAATEVHQACQQNEMKENIVGNEMDEEMMRAVEGLSEDFGTPSTFLTHSKTKPSNAEVDHYLYSPGSEMAVDASPVIPLTVELLENSDNEMEVDSPRAGSKRTSFSFDNDHNMGNGGKRARRS